MLGIVAALKKAFCGTVTFGRPYRPDENRVELTKGDYMNQQTYGLPMARGWLQKIP